MVIISQRMPIILVTSCSMPNKTIPFKHLKPLRYFSHCIRWSNIQYFLQSRIRPFATMQWNPLSRPTETQCKYILRQSLPPIRNPTSSTNFIPRRINFASPLRQRIFTKVNRSTDMDTHRLRMVCSVETNLNIIYLLINYLENFECTTRRGETSLCGG